MRVHCEREEKLTTMLRGHINSGDHPYQVTLSKAAAGALLAGREEAQ